MLANLEDIFDNRGGERLIAIKDVINKGEDSKFNIAEMDVDNTGGKYNVDIGNVLNSGVHASTNIGLQNLAIQPLSPLNSLNSLVSNMYTQSHPLILQVTKQDQPQM